MSLSFGAGQVAMAGGLLNRMGFTPAGIAVCWWIGAAGVSAAITTLVSIFMVVERFTAAVSSVIRAAAVAENPLSVIQRAAATAAVSTATAALVSAVALVGIVTALVWSWMNWCYTSTGAAILAVLKWINYVIGPGACAWSAAAAAAPISGRK